MQIGPINITMILHILINKSSLHQTQILETLNPWIHDSYLLSNLSEVSTRQQLKVRGQGTSLYDLLEPRFLMGRAKQDIISQSGILDPGLLWHKRQGTLERKTLKVRLGASTKHSTVQPPAMEKEVLIQLFI